WLQNQFDRPAATLHRIEFEFARDLNLDPGKKGFIAEVRGARPSRPGVGRCPKRRFFAPSSCAQSQDDRVKG
ncbi:MAG: hypothetical protein ACJ8G1_27810, partial [Vitreoscilla sp.]